MPITQAEAQAVTKEFVRNYPGAGRLLYYFRESTAELYRSHATEVPADFKGGYVPKEHIHKGHSFCGRVDVSLDRVRDATDLLATLRHEVLGHYGANTFTPSEKRALLDGIIAAREQPGMKDRWQEINRRYAGASMDMRAEEVWAQHCEVLTPGQHISQALVCERGQQAFMETCVARVRPMQLTDLHSIACMVAQGLHDRTRTQQNFPQLSELFRKVGSQEQESSVKLRDVITRQYGEDSRIHSAKTDIGKYRGAIVAEDETHIVQRVGKNNFVTHEKSRLSGLNLSAQKDINLAVFYTNGLAKVTPTQQLDKAQARSRNRGGRDLTR